MAWIAHRAYPSSRVVRLGQCTGRPAASATSQVPPRRRLALLARLVRERSGIGMRHPAVVTARGASRDRRFGKRRDGGAASKDVAERLRIVFPEGGDRVFSSIPSDVPFVK